jgi:hypothetical protein
LFVRLPGRIGADRILLFFYAEWGYKGSSRFEMKRRNATLLAVFLSAAASLSSALVSCGPQYDSDSEGSKEAPIELSTEVHRGRVGMGGGKLSGSYYSFVSTLDHPTIFYGNRSPNDDLDCFIYTDPDFYNGYLGANQDISDDCWAPPRYDLTGVRLYVHIANYDHEHVVEYDIYYR